MVPVGVVVAVRRARVAHPAAGPHFEDAGDEILAAVTRTLRLVLGALAADLADPPYNVVVQNAPVASAARWSRWYVEVIPSACPSSPGSSSAPASS